jgi:hypothetical protein
MVEEEFQHLRDKAYIQAEQYERETELMWELYEQEQKAKVVLGKGRKSSKSIQHARVISRKYPRFLSIQSNNRRVQAASGIWNRPEPSVHSGVFSRRD